MIGYAGNGWLLDADRVADYWTRRGIAAGEQGEDCQHWRTVVDRELRYCADCDAYVGVVAA